MRAIETRIFHQFGTSEVHREVTTRCATWDGLANAGLPTDPKFYASPNEVVPKIPLSTDPHHSKCELVPLQRTIEGGGAGGGAGDDEALRLAKERLAKMLIDEGGDGDGGGDGAAAAAAAGGGGGAKSAELEEVEGAIATQVEYYFSDENLPGDKFLREELEKSDGEDKVCVCARAHVKV